MAALAGTALAIPAVTGQNVKSFPTFITPQAQPETPASTMQRAPLNPNANMGTNIFGVTCVDYDKYYHFANLWSERATVLDKAGMVLRTDMGDNEDFPEMYTIIAGAWGGDGWYGYKGRWYTIGIMYVDSWIKADPATGEYTKIVDLYSDQSAYTPTVDLAWNPADTYMYGLVQSSYLNADNSVTSRIVNIDRKTGKITKNVKQLENYYFCMAFNYDGDLYAIRWDYDFDSNLVGAVLDIMDPSDDFEIIQSKNLTVDNKSFKIYYQNTLDFDYTTGDLWWGATNNEATQYLVKIDPQRLTTENKGKIGMQEAITGMNIPYRTADKRTAPAAVSDLNFTIDPNGDNKVTLTWTNPSKQWNLATLKSLSEVLIYRDSYEGQPVATLDATGKVGEAMSWTDETAGKGIHTYYVTACANKGEKGISSQIDAYVGHDVPGPVENLNAVTPDGKSVNVTWNAPSRGDNDGWFDASSVEYTIVRMPGNVDLGTVKTTSYEDKDLPEAQAYTYIVTARNTDGAGTPVTSPAVLAGRSVVLPFTTDFPTKIDADRFTSIDKNHDGVKWEYDFNLVSGGESMALVASKYDNDDILVSPPLSLTKGTTYKVVYEMTFSGYGDSNRVMLNHFRTVGGLEATEAGMTEVYDDFEDFRTEGLYDNRTYLTSYFTSPVDGDYYIGLEMLTKDEEDMCMYVEKFSIEAAPDDDLEAKSFESYNVLSSAENNLFKVSVYNNGANTASDYAVQMAYIDDNGKPVVFAKTTEVPAIESHQTAVVNVIGYPQGVNGRTEIMAMVDYAKDGNPSNNTSASTKVDFDEAPALNYTVEGIDPGLSTSIPLTHFNAYSASQIVYTPEMLGLAAIAPKVTINRVAFEYDSTADISDNSIQLYLEPTSEQGFADGASWIPVTSSPVFDSMVDIEAGNHYLMADLDNSFVLDTKYGLLLTLNKHEAAMADFLVMFHVFDGNWTNPYFHALTVRGGSPVNVATEQVASRWPEAPVLHLSIEEIADGVDEIVVAGASAYYFNNSTRSLHAGNADLSSVEVYDFSGRKVRSIVATGMTDIAIDVPAGMYILNLVRDGKRAASLKVNVGK